MVFRTEIFPRPSDIKLNHHHQIITFGSCFSEHIGNMLSEYKFATCNNPYGTIFNPVSLAKAISFSLDNKFVGEENIQHENGRFFHFDFHSSFNSNDKWFLIKSINNSIQSVNNVISKSDFIILTLGSSFAYRHIVSDKIVNNCHKIHGSEFTKVLLSVEDSFLALKSTLMDLLIFNPKIQVIVTICPVRHIKDGLVENNLSKSHLIQLAFMLCELHHNIHYFPSYEIMMDDLRDYRFYKEDLIHPSLQAINYIWEKFSETFFTKETILLNIKLKKLFQGIKHSPISFDLLALEKHKADTLLLLKNIKIQHPHIDFNKEEALLL